MKSPVTVILNAVVKVLSILAAIRVENALSVVVEPVRVVVKGRFVTGNIG